MLVERLGMGLAPPGVLSTRRVAASNWGSGGAWCVGELLGLWVWACLAVSDWGARAVALRDGGAVNGAVLDVGTEMSTERS